METGLITLIMSQPSITQEFIKDGQIMYEYILYIIFINHCNPGK